jgi:hypothetical protein
VDVGNLKIFVIEGRVTVSVLRTIIQKLLSSQVTFKWYRRKKIKIDHPILTTIVKKNSLKTSKLPKP